MNYEDYIMCSGFYWHMQQIWRHLMEAQMAELQLLAHSMFCDGV